MNTIVIYIEGGLVQNVVSDENVRIILVDSDEGDEDHPYWCRELQAFVQEICPEVDPSATTSIVKHWESV